jgi:Pyruvate/2-oxoacid:ferredoxin oxidoreductase gamma subunit
MRHGRNPRRKPRARHQRASRLQAVNDFVVQFANVNGSGSASANRLFARSIIRMGVPIASRNIFPSNIQGLPTWYEVRVSGQGHLGRRGGVDFMVAMNPQTWDKDVASIEPGGYLFYDSTRPMPASKFRDDVNVVGMPLTQLTNAHYQDPRQRQLFKNIIYVGALAQLLGVELDVVQTLIAEQFKGKEKLIPANYEALRIGPCLCGRASSLDRPEGRALGRSRRAHLHRGKRRGRARLRLWRRNGRGLVSDHALDLVGRGFREALRALPGRPRNRARTGSRSCRPRTSLPRSAW